MRYIAFVMILMLAVPAHAQNRTIAGKPGEASIHVPLTKSEKRVREVEELRTQEAAKTEKWKRQMNALEKHVPDHIEKIIDVLTDEQKAALDPVIKSIYDQKKIKRSQKPR